MNDISIQFKGDDSERVETFIKCAKPGTAFTLTHYIIESDDHASNSPRDKQDTKDKQENSNEKPNLKDKQEDLKGKHDDSKAKQDPKVKPDSKDKQESKAKSESKPKKGSVDGQKLSINI